VYWFSTVTQMIIFQQYVEPSKLVKNVARGIKEHPTRFISTTSMIKEQISIKQKFKSFLIELFYKNYLNIVKKLKLEFYEKSILNQVLKVE
jgi:hypothetical protein